MNTCEVGEVMKELEGNMTDDVVEKLENMLTVEWMLSNHSKTEGTIKPSSDIFWTSTLLIIFYEGCDYSFILPTSVAKIGYPWRGNLTDSMKESFEEFVRVAQL